MNQKINKILACVDLSDYSLMVLEYAMELSDMPRTHILVYNVINQRDITMLETVSRYVPNQLHAEEYIRDMKKDRETQIRTMIKENFFEKKTGMSFMVDVGIPAEAILRTIEIQDIDLVVMANKGRGNLSRFLFGSAAEKVFRHSLVPVVNVRKRKNFKREK
jgi:nucleotide-binding universal stress UspA family protein